MPNDNTYKSPEYFLKPMDPVTFYGDPRSEITKLSRAQLDGDDLKLKEMGAPINSRMDLTQGQRFTGAMRTPKLRGM